tara:strand:- start:3326 stop:3508 length:183 start_codon:yes stop_codon:yes gene_type:complete
MKITVKDLRELLELEPDDAVVYAIYTDAKGVFKERALYKTATAADDTEHYLYLSDACRLN